jgi:glycerol-3-phosphate dehydrogenase (NAD(P)+)
MRIAILGAGAWGTALASVTATRHDVVLFARDPAQAAQLLRDRENRRYLPGIALPAPLEITSDRSAALEGAELAVIATPLAGLRNVCLALADGACPPVVWLCKGLEEGTNLLPHAIVRAALPEARGAVLSGPSFALEVAQGRPTALTVASGAPELQQRVVEAFHSAVLRVYSSPDVVGVEVGGAVKNVLAIATGISDGLGLGSNARAALITRGLSEMMRLGGALGARGETLMGLTGVGDLILTCTGTLSRNRKVGLALGQGAALASVLEGLGHVAEGVRCARGVQALARSHRIDMPITDAVCSVLFEAVPAQDAVDLLLARSPRSE